MVNGPNYFAGGNIPVARFVKMSADNTVVVNAAATTKSVGVSIESGRAAPTPDGPATIYCAISGEPVKVYGMGEECLLTYATTITFGQMLASDGTGQGTPVTPTTPGTLNWVGAMALEGGAANELRRVLVLPPTAVFV